jgi:hypothetical protein
MEWLSWEVAFFIVLVLIGLNIWTVIDLLKETNRLLRLQIERDIDRRG